MNMRKQEIFPQLLLIWETDIAILLDVKKFINHFYIKLLAIVIFFSMRRLFFLLNFIIFLFLMQLNKKTFICIFSLYSSDAEQKYNTFINLIDLL